MKTITIFYTYINIHSHYNNEITTVMCSTTSSLLPCMAITTTALSVKWCCNNKKLASWTSYLADAAFCYKVVISECNQLLQRKFVPKLCLDTMLNCSHKFCLIKSYNMFSFLLLQCCFILWAMKHCKWQELNHTMTTRYSANSTSLEPLFLWRLQNKSL